MSDKDFVNNYLKDFSSLISPNDEIIDMDVLKKLKLVPKNTKKVKVILSGELKKAVKTKGLNYTNAARSAVEASGGSIED